MPNMDVASLFEKPYVFSEIVFNSLDIDAFLARESADKLREASCLVFKVNRQTVADFSGMTESASQLRSSAITRVTGRMTFLVCFNEDMQVFDLYSIEALELKKYESPESVAAACKAEITAIILGGKGCALIVPPESIHFELPSGAHAGKFLRVADAIVDMQSLDAVCFWLLDSISKAKVILVDNWSILPIALRGVAMLPTAGTLVDFFPGHAVHEGAGVSDVVRYALRNLKKGEKALFLLSVIGSGAFKELLEREFLIQGRADAIEVKAICSFADSPPNNVSLCRLALSSEFFHDSGTCGHCSRESKAIPIDPSSYYPKKVDETGVIVHHQRHMRHFRSLFDRYGHVARLFTVHRDDPNDGRHHGFYVDVARLLEIDEFKKRFSDSIDKYSNVDLIVVPDHAVGILLAKIVSAKLNVPILKSRSFADVPSDARTMLSAARCILILDDQVISGSQLKKFIESLRENAKLYGGFEEVNFLVALSRGESMKQWKGLETALTKGYSWKASLNFIEQICLPNIRAGSCPWCREYELIKSYTSTQANPEPWINDRLLRLAERERGLAESSLFLLPGTMDVSFGDGSQLAEGGSSSICTLFAFAAALQLLRTDDDQSKALHRGFPTSNVFAARRNLENLSEALLRGIILRTIFRDEWGAENRSEASRFFIKEVKPGQEYWLGEFFLAMVAGRMPKISASEFLSMVPQPIQSASTRLIDFFLMKTS
jgi:orotate phosphoribosyltransferase